jgi:hypothetical protein
MAQTIFMPGLPAFLAYIGSIPRAGEFDRDGLGDGMLNLQADSMYSRFIVEEGHDGRFEENRGTYGEQKREDGVEIGIGLHFGGDMSQHENFGSVRDVRPTLMTMFFGADDYTRRKGMWFQSGTSGYDDQDVEPSGAQNQPPRPFYFMNNDDVNSLFDVFTKGVMDRLT